MLELVDLCLHEEVLVQGGGGAGSAGFRCWALFCGSAFGLRGARMCQRGRLRELSYDLLLLFLLVDPGRVHNGAGAWIGRGVKNLDRAAAIVQLGGWLQTGCHLVGYVLLNGSLLLLFVVQTLFVSFGTLNNWRPLLPQHQRIVSRFRIDRRLSMLARNEVCNFRLRCAMERSELVLVGPQWIGHLDADQFHGVVILFGLVLARLVVCRLL